MKIRLIITARGWAYKLHAKPDDQGRYYAHLADQGGQPLEHGPVISAFESLDAVVLNAPHLYAALVAKVLTGPGPENPSTKKTAAEAAASAGA